MRYYKYSHILPRALCGEMLTVPAGQWAVCLLNALSLGEGQRFFSFTNASPSLGLTTTAPVRQTVSMKKKNLLHTILIRQKRFTPSHQTIWSIDSTAYHFWDSECICLRLHLEQRFTGNHLRCFLLLLVLNYTQKKFRSKWGWGYVSGDEKSISRRFMMISSIPQPGAHMDQKQCS